MAAAGTGVVATAKPTEAIHAKRFESAQEPVNRRAFMAQPAPEFMLRKRARSAAEPNRHENERYAETQHEQARAPSAGPGVLRPPPARKEEHADQDRVGCAYRDLGILHDKKRYYRWQRREEDEHEDRQSREHIVRANSRSLDLRRAQAREQLVAERGARLGTHHRGDPLVELA